ncbi:MAG: SDR family NAD(P)-dependent oxidoreductase [Sulfurimonas sp.]|nr:SDR family NAD(P)-dependent oxidoreductase [Sulfurimonas sp.]
MSLIRKILNRLRPKKIVQVSISTINYGDILKDKSVLITGGSSGIGLAIAKKCLSEGAKVTISGRNINKLKDVSTELNNPNLFVIEWDISKNDTVDEKVNEVIQKMGKIDIFFNNSGVYTHNTFFDIDEKIFDTIMDINIKGLFFTTKEVAKYFINNNIKGKIINISSVRSIQGTTEPYGISKWGVRGLTSGLAKELIKHGIIVNAVAPGITATGINNIDVEENATSSSALNSRVATSEEIAEIAIFLASNAANHIIGQTIVCDGGETLI